MSAQIKKGKHQWRHYTGKTECRLDLLWTEVLVLDGKQFAAAQTHGWKRTSDGDGLDSWGGNDDGDGCSSDGGSSGLHGKRNGDSD